MNVVEFKKAPGQIETIVSLKVDEEMLVDFSKANSLRTLISADIKEGYPSLSFKTEKVIINEGKKTKKYLKIWRVA